MPDQHPTTPAARSDARASDPDATAPGTTRPTNSEFGLGAPAVPGEPGALGPYRVLKELGRGGMGAVYRAIDTRLDRTVALKVLLPELAADPAARERFLREAKAAAKLSHDNVVTVYEADERDGVPYIAMQLLQGYPLDQYLKTKGAPPLAHVVRIGIEAARGLAAAHALGLVHRDIKPANLWLESPNGRVKVLDFGLAKPVGTDAELTKSGAVVGTPAYMSPEQARGLKVDHRTDVFSLGAVLYRVLAGRNPFAGANMMAVLMALGTEDPTPLRELNAEVPAALAELIHRMLAKKPEDRPQSAQEVAHALRAVLAQPSAEVSTSQPVVVQAVPVAAPMEVSAVGASAFANLMDDDAEAQTEHEAEPVTEAAGAGGSRKGLLLAGGVLALFTVVAVAVVLGTGGKNPDDTATGGDPAGVTHKPNEKNPPKKGGELPAVPAWKPIPVGESPFDKLDPNEIPKDERVEGQPKELVAVIGKHERRHWGEVNAIAFSPDGKLVATGSAGLDYIILWDVATQSAKHRLQWNSSWLGTGSVDSLQFSDDGKRLFAGMRGNGTGLRIADLSGPAPKWLTITVDGKETTEWYHQGGSRTTAFESGNTFAVWNFHSVPISLYDWNNGTPKLVTEKFPITGFPVFVPRTNQMIYASPEGKLRRATIRNAKFVDDAEIPIPLEAREYPRAVSNNGKVLALWVKEHLEIWDIAGEKPKKRADIKADYRARIDSRYSLCADGRWLTGTYTHTALWRIDGAEPKLADWLDQTGVGDAGSVVFSQDGNRAVVGNSEGFVRFWDVSGAEPKELSPFDPTTAFHSPNWGQGPALDAARGSLMLTRYDVQPNRFHRYELWNLGGTKPAPLSLLDLEIFGPFRALGQDRWLQIGVGHDHRSRLYRSTPDGIKPHGQPFGEPNTLGNVSPDGKTLVVYTPFDKPAELQGWDVSTDQPKLRWNLKPQDHTLLGSIAGCKVWFSADNRWITTQDTAAKEGEPWKLVIWRNTGAKPEVHATLPCTCYPAGYGAAFSPDGRTLAHTPEQPHTISIMDLTGPRPKEIQKFDDYGRLAALQSLAFHPNGKHLAYGSHIGAGVLDVTTGKTVWEWKAPGPVDWLEWAADGRHLVTHNGNKTVYVLRLTQFGTTEKAAADPDRKAVEWVLSKGGMVRVNGDDSDIRAVGELPKDRFTLTWVNIYNKQQVTDSELKSLSDIKTLKGLILVGTQVTDAGLANLPACGDLVELQLELSGVTDAGLARFAKCTKLQSLNVGQTPVTDEGIAHFKGSKAIIHLVAHHTKLTDNGLALFKDHKGLITLHLFGTAITDAALAQIKEYRELSTLGLGRTRVTDAGLAQLKGLNALQSLDLSETAVTDTGLAHLKNLAGLNVLNLRGAQVTAKGLADFHAAVPGCGIQHDGGVIEPGKK